MANHPISLVSPVQIIQASMARNSENFSPNDSMLPSTGVGEHPETAVSGAPGTVLTDNYAMQANDETAFIFGSTASNRSASSSDYTTVDDATKLASRAAMDNDVIEKITREGKRKKQPSQKNDHYLVVPTESASQDEEGWDENNSNIKNSILVASYGRV